MILKPCVHCRHKEGCAIKADILARSRAAGLRLTSATFRCPERWKDIEVGRRVTVAFRDLMNISEGDGEFSAWETARWISLEPISGTIVGPARDGLKLAIWLDRESNKGHVRIALHPDFPGLTLLPEVEEICPECGLPEHGAVRGTWECNLCGMPSVADQIAEDNAARFAAGGFS